MGSERPQKKAFSYNACDCGRCGKTVRWEQYSKALEKYADTLESERDQLRARLAEREAWIAEAMGLLERMLQRAENQGYVDEVDSLQDRAR